MIFILKKEYGFTAIEIIIVLILTGIMSMVVISKRTDLGVEAVGGREVIKNHIRYSQLMAMKSNRVCGVQFNGSTYSIFRNGSTTDKITLVNTEGVNLSIPPSLGSTTEIIYFDLWGAPYSDGALTQPRLTGAIGNLGISMSMDTGYMQ